MKLSIVIPVYNEKKTISSIVDIISAVSLPEKITEREIIIVNDCSTDRTKETVEDIKKKHKNISIFHHEVNQGKGAALRTGFSKTSGDIVLIQDADLEYNPHEYIKLLTPILNDKADVVYGSRFIGGDSHRVLYYLHTMGNKFLTFLSNLLSDLNLTDMETCYKVFRKEVIKRFAIKENRFGFEPEITAKVAELARTEGVRIYEIGISYYGRTYAEGKKIGFKDGGRAFYCILKYNTSRMAHFVKYGISGILVALSQLAAICFLVNKIGLQSVFQQNIAFAISVEVSIIVGFVFHSAFTWQYPFKSIADSIIKFLMFQLVTLASFGIRQITFYILCLTGMHYLLNTMITIIIALIINFLGYNAWVFRKMGVEKESSEKY